MSKIILRGYYGFGNFGDDILMLTSYRLIKEIFSSDEIVICSESNSDPSYIETIIGRSVPVGPIAEHRDADWIIHGGGGVYFDFKSGNLNFFWLNETIRFIGYSRFRHVYDFFAKLKNTNIKHSKRRIGLGIGVGSYTRSSKRFHLDILSLSDFDFLLVRDEESIDHIRSYNFNYPTLLSTDLAFLSKYWLPKNFTMAPEKNTIGFVLRDWVYDNHAYLQTVLRVLLVLKKQNRELKIFSFDKRSDQHFIPEFSTNFPITVWDPQHMSIADFLFEMGKCNLIVTSRAHGAIVSTCLGIPTICLDIEPKLKNISKMLKNSSLLVEGSDHEMILSMIDNRLKMYETFHHSTLVDVENNQKIMESGITAFKEFTKQLG